MSKRLLVMMFTVLTCVLSACSDPVGPPDHYVLPEPDLSLDPARLAVGDHIVSPCASSRWWPDRAEELRQRREWVFVDVYFGQASPSGGPLAADIDRITSLGGTVLYHYNFAAVRARFLLSKVPDLVEIAGPLTVREVPDPARYDLPVVVRFARPIRDEDIELYTRLGGAVDFRSDQTMQLFGRMPDRSIPFLRNAPGVESVTPPGYICLF